VKELLKSHNICESYAQMEKGPVFLTHSVLVRNCNFSSILYHLRVIWRWKNKIVILKSGLEVTRDHWNWCHSKDWVRFPIRLL